jgi:hypothetical protein
MLESEPLLRSDIIMPYIVIAEELNEDEVRVAAKICGCSYIGHVMLHTYKDGNPTFSEYSDDADLLESISFVAKIKSGERGAITTIELDGEIKTTLQLQMKFAERFLGEVDEASLGTTTDRNSLRYISSDLTRISELSEISIPHHIADKIDSISFNVKDVILQRHLYPMAESLMNWDSYVTDAIEIIEEKALKAKLFKA